jgi:uncharacterized delta-60 repeat protein
MYYTDADHDGYGDPESSTVSCTMPPDTSEDDTDCDDTDPEVHPMAEEQCDGVDDDCDGEIDEAHAVDAVVWFSDDDGDGFGDPDSTQMGCEAPAGFTADSSDCNDGDDDIHPDALERCDGEDNDCDGFTDGADAIDPSTWYADTDDDGFGDAEIEATACWAPEGFVADATDCDDALSGVNPGAVEVCDGIDNDCSGEVDGLDAVDLITVYLDGDGDGHGDPAVESIACEAPEFYVASDLDCDDTDSAIHPDGIEACNGIDDNCDGEIDDGTESACGEGTCVAGECEMPCETGQLDIYFGIDGIAHVNLGGDDSLTGMAIDGADRIVMTGSAGTGQFETIRVTADGVLDASFGGDGQVSTGFPVNSSSAAVAIQDDGQILVVGSTSQSCSETWNRYALARYNPDGSLDPSFGSGGTQTTNWGSVGSALYDIGFQSDGKIVVSGTRYAGACSPGISHSTVTRYSAYGVLDTSFGSGGETRRDIPHGPHHDHNRAVVIAPDDSIFTTASEAYHSWAGVQRYGPDGNFLGEVFLSTEYGAGIDIDSSDRIVAGTTLQTVRMFLDGSLDPAFGGDGYADPSPAPFPGSTGGIVVDASDRVLVVSHSATAFRVARYLPDGTLDPAFGSGGVAVIDPGYSDFRAVTVDLQSDGKIIVGGVSDGLGERDFAVARICP